MRIYTPLRNSLALISLIAFAAPFVQMHAQPRGGSVAANKSGGGAKCSGAWTGSVKYIRTQSMTDNKTVDRVSGRGQDTKSFEMKYNYQAQVAVIEDASGGSSGRAQISHNFTANETNRAVEKNSCDRGKTWQDMRGTSTSETHTSGTGTESANVHVGVNSDGTYSVSVGIPSIKGRTTGKQTSTYSGQCTPKEGTNLTMPPTETTIDGNSLTSDGTHRISENDPNRISGSYTRRWENVTETITWNLQKCGAPLRITDLKFEDMKFPNWNDWAEISETKGTIDGNLVKIKAKVLNASGETKYADIKIKDTYKGDKWDGARPDGLLENGELSVRVEPGEEREVELVWDSSGYSWFDDGRPRLLQRIKAELEENGKKVDEMTKNLKVAPKPVVLVHGLWSNWKAWETWQNILTTSHSYDWKAFAVGENAAKGVMNTGGEFLSAAKTNSIFENAQELGKYIRYAQEDRNAWHVDIVAHSMGGLISRHYIHNFMPPVEDGRPQVAHLVMLGTPNMGSPCGDVMNSAFELLGKNVEAVRQLRQDVVAQFNQVTTNRKGVKFSVLAGDPLPVMCKTYVWNDGVVPVESAIWKIKDHAKSKSLHTELTGTKDFSDFVKPRLAIGPKGDHNPAPPELPQYPGSIGQQMFEMTNASEFAGRRYGAVGTGDPVASQVEPMSFAKSYTLAPKQKLEVDVPIEAVVNFGITLMAVPNVSATLYTPAGAKAGASTANTPEAGGWFRSIFVDKDVKAGTWKLVFENLSDRESEVIFAVWADAPRN